MLDIFRLVATSMPNLTSTLTYQIHAESQKPEPNLTLITEWEALDQEVFEIEDSLPGTDVTAYQQAIQTYSQRTRELRPLVNQYMGKPQA